MKKRKMERLCRGGLYMVMILLVTACSENEMIETENTGVLSESSESSDWREIYSGYLAQPYEDGDIYYVFFLDNDEIPEIIRKGKEEACLLSVQEGHLLEEGIKNGEILYYPHGNRLHCQYKEKSQGYDLVVSIEDRSIKTIGEGEWIIQYMKENTINYSDYVWNGRRVMKDEYRESLWNCFDDTNAAEASEASFSWEELMTWLDIDS